MIETFFRLNVKKFLVLDYIYKINRCFPIFEIHNKFPEIHKSTINKWIFEFTAYSMIERTTHHNYIISDYGKKIYDGIDRATQILEDAEKCYK